MFDFAWSEFAVIAVVALIAIGPKDLPVAIRAVTGALKKARRMASEFQTHVEEMVREANLDEVRDQISQIRNFDVKAMVAETVDSDHSIRDAFATNPLDPITGSGTEAGAGPQLDGDLAVAELDRPADADVLSAADEGGDPAAPAFIPPALTASAVAEPPSEAPAFIPPSVVELTRSRARL